MAEVEKAKKTLAHDKMPAARDDLAAKASALRADDFLDPGAGVATTKISSDTIVTLMRLNRHIFKGDGIPGFTTEQMARLREDMEESYKMAKPSDTCKRCTERAPSWTTPTRNEENLSPSISFKLGT